MPSLTCFNFRFTPNWLMMILAVGFIALFVRLGFWQIDRAHQKKSMVLAEQAQALKTPQTWRAGDLPPAPYQRLELEGHYLSDLFLLDNQHHNHQFGYDAVSALELVNGDVVLVDRGWVAGDHSRLSLPGITIPEGVIKIKGSAYYPSQNSWVLGPELEKKGKKISIIERIDVKLLSQILQKKVYPFIMRLAEQEEHGFVRDWAIVSMPPERHLAYALQWFVMALVILIIFVALNLKKNR